MRHLTKLFIAAFLFTPAAGAFAQAGHNLAPNSWCRFVKKTGRGNSEAGSGCPACIEDGKKNAAALKKESERQAAAGKRAEAEALRKLEQDYVKRNEAHRKAIEAQRKNVVTFALPKPEGKTATVAKPAPVNMKGGYIYTVNWGKPGLQQIDNYGKEYGFALNAKGDTILRRNELFYEFFGVSLKKTEPSTFPPGVVVTKLRILAPCKGNTGKTCLPVWDLVDARGKRYFGDNSIVGINHITGNFFLIVYAPADGSYYAYSNYDKAAIYNLSNKSFYWLEDRVTRFNEPLLSISNSINDLPEIPNYTGAHDGFRAALASAGIKHYVVLKTGGYVDYGDDRAIIYITPEGKIARKVLRTVKGTTTEIR
ncbi:MAG: hypothetical protein EOP50_07490 [Sphingobacteriales bacterium]|nr:MAG: hypothetical protein EOP50_07490 [Sphingobacteriales bacterium]